GSVGNVVNWLSSADGISWTAIPATGATYTAQNLTATTQYRVLVQNGNACSIDSSTVATIMVDPKSVGGTLTPDNVNVCLGQTTNTVFTLTGSTGNVVNW